MGCTLMRGLRLMRQLGNQGALGKLLGYTIFDLGLQAHGPSLGTWRMALVGRGQTLRLP